MLECHFDEEGEVGGVCLACHSLLQQLLPLLLPQGLQVIGPLQGSLSEERAMFSRAVSHLSASLSGSECCSSTHTASHLVLLPQTAHRLLLLQDGRLDPGREAQTRTSLWDPLSAFHTILCKKRQCSFKSWTCGSRHVSRCLILPEICCPKPAIEQ